MAALDDFNAEPPDGAVQALRACNAAPRSAAAVAADRPYPDVDVLVTRAEEVVRELPWEEVPGTAASRVRPTNAGDEDA
jgi:2-oxo-4-hydroxy-4-carboxy-5-ureidoimidazoline decarboxylase